jgi:hypothetical protein
VTRPTVEWLHRLDRVRNRSKFRRHGPEARRLKVTRSGHSVIR